MTAAKTAPHKKGLTRQRVVEAAIELVETQGMEALTMRRLASAVGVEAMSLYTYFDTKHALELAMCDHMLGAVADRFNAQDGEADAVAFAHAIRDGLLRHPNTARLFAMHMNLQESPVVQRLTMQSLAILARHDADAETVLYRFGTLLAFVIGHCLLEISQQNAGAPPTSIYDPVRAFEAGVAALLNGVFSSAPQHGSNRP